MWSEGVNQIPYLIILGVGLTGVLVAMVGAFLLGADSKKESKQDLSLIKVGLAVIGTAAVFGMFIAALMAIDGASGRPVHVSESHLTEVIEKPTVAILSDVTEDKFYFILQGTYSRVAGEKGTYFTKDRDLRLVSFDHTNVKTLFVIFRGTSHESSRDPLVKDNIGSQYLLQTVTISGETFILVHEFPPRNIPYPIRNVVGEKEEANE